MQKDRTQDTVEVLPLQDQRRIEGTAGIKRLTGPAPASGSCPCHKNQYIDCNQHIIDPGYVSPWSASVTFTI